MHFMQVLVLLVLLWLEMLHSTLESGEKKKETKCTDLLNSLDVKVYAICVRSLLNLHLFSLEVNPAPLKTHTHTHGPQCPTENRR